jgi:2-amino-4-hydroxy-6-hydroxymethyldihydropteridine diphosphokinase
VGRRIRAYIGLGSNVGDPAATLARAVEALAALPGARLRGVSRLYATTPVGVREQPDFMNAVVALDVPAGHDPESGALGLLGQLKAVERRLGRKDRLRWGPREIDLDLLLFGRSRVQVERPQGLEGESAIRLAARARQSPTPRWLEVPHRDVAERLFVLAPLAELAPRLVPPGWRQTVESVRRRRARLEGEAAARPVANWETERACWDRVS